MVEIRINKRRIIPTLVFITIPILGIAYYTFFTEKGKANSIMAYVFFLILALAFYSIYRIVKMILSDQPVLTISKSFVEINEGGNPISFIWPKISNWEVIKGKNNHFLIIETDEQKKKLNITWLEKEPAEIEELMNQFFLK